MAKAPRGRPRLFDEDEAIDVALGLFWRSGYRGTTTRKLEAALDMRQPSIYNAFGSKRDLLLRVMDRYQANAERELFSLLNSGDNGYEAIIAFFRALGEWKEPSGYQGCLMVNLMSGEVDDEVIVERVQVFRAQIFDGFAAAIRRSEADRDLIDRRARVLQSAMLGLKTASATAQSSSEVQSMVDGVCDMVTAWQVQSSSN